MLQALSGVGLVGGTEGPWCCGHSLGWGWWGVLRVLGVAPVFCRDGGGHAVPGVHGVWPGGPLGGAPLGSEAEAPAG